MKKIIKAVDVNALSMSFRVNGNMVSHQITIDFNSNSGLSELKLSAQTSDHVNKKS